MKAARSALRQPVPNVTVDIGERHHEHPSRYIGRDVAYRARQAETPYIRNVEQDAIEDALVQRLEHLVAGQCHRCGTERGRPARPVAAANAQARAAEVVQRQDRAGAVERIGRGCRRPGIDLVLAGELGIAFGTPQQHELGHRACVGGALQVARQP